MLNIVLIHTTSQQNGCSIIDFNVIKYISVALSKLKM